ncbi:MAG: hypothetical protein ABSA76_00950 [Bacteroidales bacterium]
MGAIIELILQLLAGVGLTVGIEKFLPNTPVNPQTGIGSWGPLKIALFVLILAAGGFLLIFLGKKLGIKIFKHRR